VSENNSPLFVNANQPLVENLEVSAVDQNENMIPNFEGLVRAFVTKSGDEDSPHPVLDGLRHSMS
jgi:hypothetical protein